ncbi:MAG: hypothetical protein ACKVS8_10585 [Phycisphaerales bacterium]
MTIEQLRRTHAARPFRPFTIHVADGRSFKISHPEFLAITGAGRTVIVGSERDDSFEVVDLLLVTTLQVHENGRGSGRRAA